MMSPGTSTGSSSVRPSRMIEFTGTR
jgi:hypothetical protein